MAVIPVCVAVVPAFVWAGSITARVRAVESAQEKVETGQEKVVQQPEFKQFSARVLESLQRIEAKLDHAHQR